MTGLAAGRALVQPWSAEDGDLGTGYEIDLKPNQPNTIDLLLRDNSISGLVTLHGRPVANVEVLVEYVQPGEPPDGLVRTTNADGEVVFYDLDPGRWRISVAEPISASREVEVAIGENARVELKLD